MPKENQTKRFQFFLNMNITKDQNLFIWIKDEIESTTFSKFIREILESRMNGTNQNSIDLRDKKLDVEIRLKETQIKINERRLLYYDTFGNSPSFSAKVAITKGVINQNPVDNISCYDEKNDRFQCPECGILFNYSKDHSDISESKLQFADHYFQKHGALSEMIVKEMSEII